MRCEEVQAEASAWLDAEVPEDRAKLLAAHEAGCAECHGFLRDLRRLSAGIARLGSVAAPEGLQARVRGRLAKEVGQGAADPAVSPRMRLGNSRFLSQVSALAATCLLSVFGTWAFLTHQDAEGLARHDVAAAHMRALLQDSPIQVASSDQHTVRPWFNGRVEFAPPVKDLTAEGFPLIGGRLDYVEGHRVATLVYRRHSHTVSVFIWPEAAGQGQAWKPDRVAGLNLLSWRKDGMIWWAVSDLNPEDLRELRSLL